jgi:hypothetical protein
MNSLTSTKAAVRENVKLFEQAAANAVTAYPARG